MDEYVNQVTKKLTSADLIKGLLFVVLFLLIGMFGFGWKKSGSTFIQTFSTGSSKLLKDDVSKYFAKSQRKKDDVMSNQKCTFSLFRRYYAEYNYLPRGKWENCFDSIQNKNTTCYQPNICKYHTPRITKNYIQQCLNKANVSSVMTIGDSNALRYFRTINKLLDTCKIISQEHLKEKGFVPDINYLKGYAGNLQQYLSVHYRFCSGCGGIQVECQPTVKTPNKTKKIFAEHIPMTMLFDDSVQFLPPNYHVAQANLQNMWAINWQEFVLRYVLKDRYPDVFLIFTPFVHMKFMNLDRLRAEMGYFHSLVEYYIPKTTKIFYMPTFSEFEKARPDKAKAYLNRKYQNMLAANKIDHMNHVMFSVLKNDLVNSSHQVYSFLDLFNVSWTQAAWSTDGVHMAPVWYETIMSMFWETFCNSVYDENFN